MTAKELISNDIMPLLPSDKISQAMSMMSIYRVRHLPIVKDGILLGTISEEEVSSTDIETSIRDVKITSTYIQVQSDYHVFELLSTMSENNLSVVPVVDAEDRFLGIVSQEDLIKFFASTFSFKENGGIIVIETNRQGYSLSEIARIVELENASIIASFITSNYESDITLITLKISQREINDIISALERYSYKIRATFTEAEYTDDLKNRYDHLMRYLDV